MLPVLGSYLTLKFLFERYLPLAVLSFVSFALSCCILPDTRKICTTLLWSITWFLLSPSSWFTHHYELAILNFLRVVRPVLETVSYVLQSPAASWVLRQTSAVLLRFTTIPLAAYCLPSDLGLVIWYAMCLVSLHSLVQRRSSGSLFSSTWKKRPPSAPPFALPVCFFVLSAVQLTMSFCHLYGACFGILRILFGLRNRSSFFVHRVMKAICLFALVGHRRPPDPIFLPADHTFDSVPRLDPTRKGGGG